MLLPTLKPCINTHIIILAHKGTYLHLLSILHNLLVAFCSQVVDGANKQLHRKVRDYISIRNTAQLPYGQSKWIAQVVVANGID